MRITAVVVLAAASVVTEQVPLQRATINIDTSVRYQTIDGFGVSAAFQRFSDINGKKGMSPENTTLILDYLFSSENGAGLTILCNGIGSSTSTRLDFMNSIGPR
jgi:O-glycosyl hydrolase